VDALLVVLETRGVDDAQVYVGPRAHVVAGEGLLLAQQHGVQQLRARQLGLALLEVGDGLLVQLHHLLQHLGIGRRLGRGLGGGLRSGGDDRQRCSDEDRGTDATTHSYLQRRRASYTSRPRFSRLSRWDTVSL
jgi:hypothetical protein